MRCSASLFFATPFGGDSDEQAVVAFGHRPRKDRYVVLVEQVVDAYLERKIRKPQRERFFEVDVAHVVGTDVVEPVGLLVARGGIPFAVMVVFVGERPAFPADPSGD